MKVFLYISSVKQSMELNKKLEFVNKHHLCQIEEYKSDIARLKQENIDLKVLIEIQPQDFDQRLTVKTREIEKLKQQLRKKEEESEKFLRQNEELKEEKQALIKSLDSSHRLVDQQVQCNEQNIADIERFEGELKTLTDKYKILTEKYDTKAADYDKECSDHQEALTEWKTREDSLSSRLRSLQQDHEALIKVHGDLEDLNSSWAQMNMKLLEDIKALREKYEKEMTDQSVQTEENVEAAATQTEEDVIGRITDLEKTILMKDKNIQSLKDKVDFFEEIAKEAGHLKEIIEELRADVKKAEIIELSKVKSEVDQVTQTEGTITIEESVQTSQDFVAKTNTASTNNVDKSNEGNVGSPMVPLLDDSDDKVVKVVAELSSASSQVITESADIMVKNQCPLNSFEESKTFNLDTDCNLELLNKAVETIEDSETVFEHSETQNIERNSGNKHKRKMNKDPMKDDQKVVDSDTKSPKVATETSESKSQKLGTESRVKYLASMIQLNLHEKDETFKSQELNEALHSRLRKKVALLKGETEKDSALKSLSALSNKAPRINSPRNRFRCLGVSGDSLSTAKPGGSSPKTRSNGPSLALSSSLNSPLTANSRLGALRPTLVTTVTKSLAKPEPIYANAQQGLKSPPVALSPVIVSPSIVVGSKDNSAFSSVSQNTQTPAVPATESPKVGSSIRTGMGNLQSPSLRLLLSTSEHSDVGKRKCMELDAGDAADLNGKGQPLVGRDGEEEDEPKAGTSGILLGRPLIDLMLRTYF
ncbi:paramyosin-like [Lineus longissimus]|uniref:paramyosin-like n=1 Tax=Lineus longissimus TaxID=88925 RepID=UPI00315DDBF3